ncbi:NAD-dependent epimerase/dehydratase family protein [Flavobacterium columnare]|nr:NAD-dependent epimerase/dehydratase family protein [Flavobacterium columnare]QOG58260.1 NAD-dependent epimerase/dehydratase family protein [Flavobacterium columnare]QOG60983.1 NAD-dependent epimerase/dehydratase family protein [Flavobacterium columnare]QOG63703.1 NAD-dependent epimerase/dehydratase family protein [Flavobacterium columnare]QOG66427.1 NAD-dependent epimerase/dehydratase family protein [Flavobacterium columnare]QOG69151.1 NAD-dependent epimerase/dehydratase family protein [Fla
MKIIMTGAGGFVGQNLFGYLQKNNFEIQTLSLRKSNWDQIIHKTANAIVHLAGKAHDTKNTREATEYFNVNTDLTIQLFDEFLKSDIRDFIYFSSVKATADIVEGVLNEDHVSAPQTPYGQSKLKAEEYLLSKELPKGKRLFVLRPCMIHGPGNKGNLNLLSEVVNRGIPYPLGLFNNERSFLSIDNLNYIIEKILNDDTIKSGVYNLADDEFVSTNRLIEIIADIQGGKSRIWNVSKRTIKYIAKLGDYLRLPLNSERLQKMTENYRVSNKKIKQALNIEKLPFTAEEGLRKTIQSFKK